MRRLILLLLLATLLFGCGGTTMLPPTCLSTVYERCLADWAQVYPHAEPAAYEAFCSHPDYQRLKCTEGE